jgi:hypothetical protein
MPVPTGTDEEDELDELPPLDGDVGDVAEPEADPGEGLEADEGEASLDDATGESDPADADGLDLERDEKDRGWLEEPADSPDLDLGDTALVDLGEEGRRTTAADEPEGEAGIAEEDFGFGSGPERGGLDGGDEGPLGADEELREADLPRLDADEEGEVDDAALMEPGFAADEPVGLPWAADPWSRVGAPVALAAATAVACAPRGALVAGQTEAGVAELLRIDLEGTSQGLAASGLDVGSVRALAVEGERVAALVTGGHLMLSRDGGASFGPVAAGVTATDLALVSGTLWVRTAEGELAAVDGDGARLLPAVTGVPGGALAALACDALGGVAAIAVDGARRTSGLVRVAPGKDAACEALDAPPELHRSPALLAVRGARVAFAGERGGVVWRDARGGWASHVWEGYVTALAFVDDAGTLVAATYSEGDDTTALVRLETEAGADAPRASIVARFGPSRAGADGTDGRMLTLAYDDARGVVWVAGASGVAAFAVR